MTGLAKSHHGGDSVYKLDHTVRKAFSKLCFKPMLSNFNVFNSHSQDQTDQQSSANDK